MNISVTGANGFVGQRLCDMLSDAGHKVRASVRSGRVTQSTRPSIEYFSSGDIGPSTDWSTVLIDINVVIHLAARVHVMKESSGDPLTEYRRINVDEHDIWP